MIHLTDRRVTGKIILDDPDARQDKKGNWHCSDNPSKHNFKHKHLWVKKATGLGVIEFMLRFMLWLCLRNDDNRGNQMCIVTGGDDGNCWTT
jgi:hypothetical protein